MKTSRLLAAIVVAVTVSLTGCAMGNSAIADETQETLNQKLIRGQTTKAQIINQLGEPTMKGTAATGQEYWAYTMGKIGGKAFIPFAPLVTGSYGGSTKTLTIFFEKNDVVQNFLFGETKD